MPGARLLLSGFRQCDLPTVARAYAEWFDVPAEPQQVKSARRVGCQPIYPDLPGPALKASDGWLRGAHDKYGSLRRSGTTGRLRCGHGGRPIFPSIYSAVIPYAQEAALEQQGWLAVVCTRNRAEVSTGSQSAAAVEQ